MNLFFSKTNKLTNKLLIFLVLSVSLGFFLWFTYKQENNIYEFYLKWTYFDEIIKEKNVNSVIEQEFSAEDIKKEEEQGALLLKKFQSLQSGNQRFFLEAEIDNQLLNQELTDKFNQLVYQDYNTGKISINQYLINHHLPLKSVNYSTDSAIFTMNVLEFLNMPLFFLCFFLLMPINYYKKFEDGRIKFLVTQPLPRVKIILADYRQFLKDLTLIFGLIVLMALTSSFLVSRTMTVNYPVQLTLLGSTYLIPVYQYLLILSLTFICIGTFFFLLVYLWVLLLKRTMVALLMTFFLSLSWNLLINSSSHLIDGLNPFSYVNVEKLCKRTESVADLSYVILTDRHIGVVDDFFVGNIVEDPYYYANDSLAKRSKVVDLVLLPIILALYSLLLFLINTYLLNHYKIHNYLFK